MTNNPCVNCTKPTTDFLCGKCVDELKDSLGSVGWLVGELETTLTKQARMRAPADRTSGSTERGLPFNWDASEMSWGLHNTLSAWAKDLCETRGLQYDGVDTPAGIARWLSKNAMSIALSESAFECFDEITNAIATVRRVIDRPPGKIFIGPCGDGGCKADIYAAPHKDRAKCQDCNAIIDVNERREELREEVRGLLGTAAELARMLPWILDTPITRKRITYYGNRGSITKRPSVSKEPLYQVGEVIDAHVAFQLRHQA